MSEGPVRVLHLLAEMPLGGLELQLMQLFARYDRRRFEPVLCCMKELGELGEEARRAGIETHLVGRMKRRRFDIRVALRLARLLQRERITVLRTLQYHANLYGRLAAALAGTPVVVCSVHSAEPGGKRHRRLVNRLLALRTDAIVAVSEAAKEVLLAEDGVPARLVRVIHNGVDLERFFPVRDRAEAKRRLGLDPAEPVIVTVGRLARGKGQPYLIEALLAMKTRARCIIVGGGPKEPELRALAGRLGVSDRIVFAGPRRDVVPYLHAADLFAFPSLAEGLGNALLEAMACGLPCVVSALPAFREVAPSGEVVSVPPGDARSLASAMDGLLADPSRMQALGRAARRRVEEAFSVDRMVREYEALYEELLARKRGLR